MNNRYVELFNICGRSKDCVNIMKDKIVIAGGTGFVGNYLREKFESEGKDVIIISRSSGVTWHDESSLVEALNGAAMLINLAGKSVNCRYNERNKRLILNSRIQTTRLLGDAASKCTSPPKLWLNASTATIYRDEKTRPNTEMDGNTGEGFSVEVAKLWEETFYSFRLKEVRKVALRISIVLGKGGGVIPIFKKLTKLGLGGTQGSGEQMFSWIHIEDLYRMIKFIYENEDINGSVNCASPVPVTNNVFMRSMRKAMHVSFGLPGPKWLLEMGTVLIGTEPELIFKSRWVVPDKLQKAGYIFRFGEIEKALSDLCDS